MSSGFLLLPSPPLNADPARGKVKTEKFILLLEGTETEILLSLEKLDKMELPAYSYIYEPDDY